MSSLLQRLPVVWQVGWLDWSSAVGGLQTRLQSNPRATSWRSSAIRTTILIPGTQNHCHTDGAEQSLRRPKRPRRGCGSSRTPSGTLGYSTRVPPSLLTRAAPAGRPKRSCGPPNSGKWRASLVPRACVACETIAQSSLLVAYRPPDSRRQGMPQPKWGMSAPLQMPPPPLTAKGWSNANTYETQRSLGRVAGAHRFADQMLRQARGSAPQAGTLPPSPPSICLRPGVACEILTGHQEGHRGTQ
jgi:hypothetical protein|mmetsp:Transcript_11905/g.21925  ORF Transcript_11905/g.21925 Transcript_11905/m.21925 type:complete len:244 (-) Transcript_11905:458-1189(-)